MTSIGSFEGQLELLCSSLTLQDASVAVQTLIKITKNALEHPGEEHYRQLHTTNKTFSAKVWRHSNAREFMLSVGWVLVEDSIVLSSDDLLQDALVALTKTKSVLDMQQGSLPSPPNHSLPSPSSHPPKGEESGYQERMRKMRELQKQKELEKKRIAEQIKADRRETSQRKAQASHSTDLRFGGHMTTFEDIGVNLNKGGG